MAYTALSRPKKSDEILKCKVFGLSSTSATDQRCALLTLPFDFPAGDRLDPILQARLQAQFNVEIETGLTYPYEETMTFEGFEAYFLAFDLVLGLFLNSDQVKMLGVDVLDAIGEHSSAGITLPSDRLAGISFGACTTRAIRDLSSNQNGAVDLSDWADTYAFSYYIKPNYPGRSSHLCNAGFIVSSQARGLGLGSIAGRSYLYYGPACGYRGSVFNLVYTSNIASARIWERLGFQTIGKVPEAGRLKKKDGEGEEYVDAYIVYGDFRKIGLLD